MEKQFLALWADHTEHADKMEADECFHKLSYSEGHGEQDGSGNRFLDKDHMNQAVEDVLSKWDISLEEDGEAAF